MTNRTNEGLLAELKHVVMEHGADEQATKEAWAAAHALLAELTLAHPKWAAVSLFHQHTRMLADDIHAMEQDE